MERGDTGKPRVNRDEAPKLSSKNCFSKISRTADVSWVGYSSRLCRIAPANTMIATTVGQYFRRLNGQVGKPLVVISLFALSPAGEMQDWKRQSAGVQ